MNKEVVVVGGGDSALEQALILSEYVSKVTIIYKASSFYASSYVQERLFANSRINCIMESEVTSINGIDEGKVTGIVLKNIKTKKELEIGCEGLFISNGRKPNTDLFLGQLAMTKAGYIETKPDTTQTSLSGVFAAGDIA